VAPSRSGAARLWSTPGGRSGRVAVEGVAEGGGAVDGVEHGGGRVAAAVGAAEAGARQGFAAGEHVAGAGRRAAGTSKFWGSISRSPVLTALKAPLVPVRITTRDYRVFSTGCTEQPVLKVLLGLGEIARAKPTPLVPAGGLRRD